MAQWLRYNSKTQRWHAKSDPSADRVFCGVFLVKSELFPDRVLIDYVPREDSSEICTECLIESLGVSGWRLEENGGSNQGATKGP